MSNDESTRATVSGDGASAQGEGAHAVGARGVMIGGDNTGNVNTGTQFNFGDANSVNIHFLQPLDAASGLVQQLLASAPVNVTTSALGRRNEIAHTLADLMAELRKTHATIVDKLNPLWDIKDDPATFEQEFATFYSAFRKFYFSKDLGEERTHCHTLINIGAKLEAIRPRSGSDDATWTQLEGLLFMLRMSDMDIIEAHYRPFMKRVHDALKQINDLAEAGDVAQAIKAKQALAAALEGDFDTTRTMLEGMSDTISKLNTIVNS